MVDWNGIWTYDPTETNKKQWCDLDYVAHWIFDEMNYSVSMNLYIFIQMLLKDYENDVEVHEDGMCYYAIPDNRPYPECLMVYVPDVAAWVYDQGGLAVLEAEYSVYCTEIFT